MIRLAIETDLVQIMAVFEKAKAFMRASGNLKQWINGYPSEEAVKSDIAKGNFYVEESGGEIIGSFAFIIGEDPTYKTIEGQWLDESRYGTVHRLASDGSRPGFSDRCFDFCFKIIDNVRADTHEDNRPMQQCLERNGFAYCGIIHLADGSPRKAYQKKIK